MDLKEMLEGYGYEDVQEVPGVGWCGVGRFIFTCGVCFGMTETGVRGRFCFDTMANARLFLNEWDGRTYPQVGIDGCTAIKGVLPVPPRGKVLKNIPME